MLEWAGSLCMDILGSLWGSESPITILVFVADKSINDSIICYASASEVKVDAGLPLFWCP